MAVSWSAPDASLHGVAGIQRWQKARPPSDAVDGSHGGVPEAENQCSEPGTQTLSLPVARLDHRSEQSGLVCGYYLHPHAQRFSLSGGHHGLVQPWRLSNTMDTDFCASALEEAVAKYGKPDIFNTDQGCQFTSFAFTNILRDKGIRISMDGRGRWLDNVFIERLWRSLKYENVYLNAYETGSEARTGIGRWIDFYNQTRPHSSLGGRSPERCYHEGLLKAA